MKTMAHTCLLLSVLLLHIMSSYAVSVPKSSKPTKWMPDRFFDISSLLSSASAPSSFVRQSGEPSPTPEADELGPSGLSRIAPAVVVVAIFLIAGAIGYFYWRRRRQQETVAQVRRTQLSASNRQRYQLGILRHPSSPLGKLWLATQFNSKADSKTNCSKKSPFESTIGLVHNSVEDLGKNSMHMMTPTAFVSSTPCFRTATTSSKLSCFRRPLLRPTPARQALRPTFRMTALSTNETSDDVQTAWPDIEQASTNTATLGQTIMNTEDIMKILPHRYPFLLVDRVIAYEPGKRAMGVKSVTINEPFFPGHFPDKPIMPGVLQVEALAQLGGLIALQLPVIKNPLETDFFFGGVDKVKWRRPVTPGDTLVLEMTMDTFKERFGIAKMSGRGFVNGQLVIEGQFTLVMVMNKK